MPRPAADFPPVDVEPLGNGELAKHRFWGRWALPTLSETRLGTPVACCCVGLLVRCVVGVPVLSGCLYLSAKEDLGSAKARGGGRPVSRGVGHDSARIPRG